MHMSGAGKHWYFVLLASCGWWFLLFSYVFLPSCKTYLVLKTLRRSGLAPRSWYRPGIGNTSHASISNTGEVSVCFWLHTFERQGGDWHFFTTGFGLKP